MRIAVFSDIHGNWRAMEAVLADLDGRADVVVCGGDVAWGGPWPDRVIEALKAGGWPVVLGNTDVAAADESVARHEPWARWARERLREHHLTFLSSLSLQQQLETPAGPVLVVHSTPADPFAKLPAPSDGAGLERLFGQAGVPLVVHGHDHLPSQARLSGVMVVGAGAVGLPLDGDPRACYVVVTAEPGGFTVEHRRVAYDVEAAVAEARELEMPGAARWGEAVRRGVLPQQVGG
ncbi:metallophosphoesterase family protein [Geochorda subterranea]|uniref:Metallophosphoesterase family protein n=1 Tax=Geochorda subterranea TaxID=3109564 RepID=A0ABZ1BND9_9FIRM|nr:metallophosphoesterase family protein [Limnochorda sp. LNt]WRP14088.1 metallophosphoesterase family protein [Limnochorda sp. LNt]